MASGRRVAPVARGQWPRTCNDACGGASTPPQAPPKPLFINHFHLPPLAILRCVCVLRASLEHGHEFSFRFQLRFLLWFSKTLVFQSGAEIRFYE